MKKNRASYPRRVRLQDKARIAELFEKAARSRYGCVHALVSQQSAPVAASRFAIVVGKRHGKSVLRNRCRRLVREALRQRIAEVPKGLDVLLQVQGSFVSERNAIRRSEMLERALSRLVIDLEDLEKSSGGDAGGASVE